MDNLGAHLAADQTGDVEIDEFVPSASPLGSGHRAHLDLVADLSSLRKQMTEPTWIQAGRM